MHSSPDQCLANSSSLSAVDIYKGLRSGRCTPQAVLDQCVSRIAVAEPRVHAWSAFDPKRIGLAPDLLSGLLNGIPIAVKDLFDTVSWPTAYGSQIYAGHHPTQDAILVTKLRRCGAVIMGKTVTTEFGYFSPGPTRNPWQLGHTPGGSSSGSAAAVASGMVPIALGTQTAGSLIRPASYCGVFAFKPTFGRHSLEGVKGLSPSMDTVGWMARSAQDLELVRAALSDEDFVELTGKKPRLLASLTHEWPLVEADGARVFKKAIERLQKSGVVVEVCPLPSGLKGLFDAQKTIMAREAHASLHVHLESRPDLLSEPLKALLNYGSTVSDASYVSAQRLAEEGRATMDSLLSDVDGLLVPAAPGEAPEGITATGDPAFSRVWNLLGLPCANVPGLQGASGLPIGLQLVGRRGQDRALLEAAEGLARVGLR